MKYRPLGDRLLVKPNPSEETTKTGIVLPDSAKEKSQEGKVISVGPGKRDKKGKIVPIEVRVGDFILYPKYSGTEIKIKGKEHLIIKEEDILAIIE